MKTLNQLAVKCTKLRWSDDILSFSDPDLSSNKFELFGFTNDYDIVIKRIYGQFFDTFGGLMNTGRTVFGYYAIALHKQNICLKDNHIKINSLNNRNNIKPLREMAIEQEISN